MYYVKVFCQTYDNGLSLAQWVEGILSEHSHWEVVIQYSSTGGSTNEDHSFKMIYHSAFIYLRLKKDVETLIIEREQRLKI